MSDRWTVNMLYMALQFQKNIQKLFFKYVTTTTPISTTVYCIRSVTTTCAGSNVFYISGSREEELGS